MNMNIQNLMREAQKMQKNLEKTQSELTNTEYEGSSSCVKVILNGNKDVKSVKIDSNEFSISPIDRVIIVGIRNGVIDSLYMNDTIIGKSNNMEKPINTFPMYL